MARRRDVLAEVALFMKPERPSSSSRRVLSRWRHEVEIFGRANRALLALRDLYHGTFSDDLLSGEEIWGRSSLPENLDGDLARRVLGEVRLNLPPPSTPSPGAAIQRLRPAAPAADSQSRSNFTTFEAKSAELRRRLAGGCVRLPERGETFPSHWEHIALPPPGSRPVSARRVSPRVARKLEDFLTDMLKTDGDECVRNSELKNYVDAHFRR